MTLEEYILDLKDDDNVMLIEELNDPEQPDTYDLLCLAMPLSDFKESYAFEFNKDMKVTHVDIDDSKKLYEICIEQRDKMSLDEYFAYDYKVKEFGFEILCALDEYFMEYSEEDGNDNLWFDGLFNPLFFYEDAECYAHTFSNEWKEGEKYEDYVFLRYFNSNNCTYTNRYIVAVPKKWLDLELTDDDRHRFYESIRDQAKNIRNTHFVVLKEF